ncbi:MAG: AAA family ATPase [Psychroflexus halocasei]|uniref:AAA family ATPase n=1 Tax=Psychroflexus sp. S27 TaxID=1982757 RepID=UPI000C2A7438|nr:MoxR family ATPase [Psychroflexus sp. S27]PJX23977.1 magnesium chelatase [Psychroflexus sp. S27]
MEEFNSEEQKNTEQNIESVEQTTEHSSEFDARIPLENLKEAVTQLKSQIQQVIIGQDKFIDLLIVSLLADGHVLIEGVPGIAKTITSKLFAKTIDTSFNRIQFTPDLMPSDVLGTSIYSKEKSEFEFKKGPIFSNIVLIDEINRAPAKTQSALFEVMEEQQITMDGTTYKMPPPFMVVATQNPIEQEGTYALPEAQLDRFLFKIKLTYPSLEEEKEVIKTHHERKNKDAISLIKSVLNADDLLKYRNLLKDVIVEDKLFDYIAEIVHQTRQHPHLILGASPRASIAILNTSKVFAAIQGRDFVTPDDIKKSLEPVLNHRIVLTPEKEMEGMNTEDVVDMIVKSVEIPR